MYLLGCSTSNDGDTVTGKGSIQALHAIPDIGTVNFLIEETLLSTLTYRDASGITEYVDLEYTFSFDILLPDDTEATAIQSATLKVDAETEYTFVLAGSLTNPELVIWEQFGRDWAGELETATETDATTVLYASDPFTIIAATSNLLTVMDDGGETTAAFSVRLIGTGLGVNLYDINLDSELSLIHRLYLAKIIGSCRLSEYYCDRCIVFRPEQSLR